jgi:hypothetical protein
MTIRYTPVAISPAAAAALIAAQAAIDSATYAPRVHTIDIRNCVLSTDQPFTTDGTWTACSAVLHRVLSAIDVAPPALPVQVYFPNGHYPLTAAVSMYPRTGIAGESQTGTVFVTGASNSAFIDGGVLVSPAADIHFSDFTIDCSAQTNATYQTSPKGFHLLYLLRPVWERITVKNSWGTGFGSDYLVDYVMDHVTADGCGRGIREKGIDPLSVSGGSGIGIGTGAYASETGVITAPRLVNCGRAGLFSESLNTLPYSYGPRVVGGYASGNYIGVQDAGWDGADIGMDVVDNLYAGVLIDQTVLVNHAGKNGRFRGNIARNGTVGLANSGGVVIGQVPGGGYTFNGECHHNIGNGVSTTATAQVGPHMTFELNVHDNQGAGYVLRSSSPIVAPVIAGIVRNNGQDAGSSVRYGVDIESSTSWLDISARCADDQATPTQQVGVRIAGALTYLTDKAHLTADVRGNVAGYAIYTPTNSVVAFVGTGTDTAPPTAPIITDSFNRADSATTLGSTDGGTLGPLVWADVDLGTGGLWGIDGNRARGRAGSSLVHAVVDPGVTATTIQATLVTPSTLGVGGIAFRVQDSNNLCNLNLRNNTSSLLYYTLETRTAGAKATMTGGGTTITPVAGDVIKIVDTGTTVAFWLNGTLITTATSSAFNSNTKVGLTANPASDSLPLWDSFAVWH